MDWIAAAFVRDTRNLGHTYDLESVSNDAHSHELLAVVAAVHHEGVGQTLDDGALSLAETLGGIAASGVREVDGVTDLDVVAIFMKKDLESANVRCECSGLIPCRPRVSLVVSQVVFATHDSPRVRIDNCPTIDVHKFSSQEKNRKNSRGSPTSRRCP